MTTISKEEIVKLIKYGFDLELLSFELNIPIEQLKEYSKELNSKKEDEKDVQP